MKIHKANSKRWRDWTEGMFQRKYEEADNRKEVLDLIIGEECQKAIEQWYASSGIDLEYETILQQMGRRLSDRIIREWGA